MLSLSSEMMRIAAFKMQHTQLIQWQAGGMYMQIDEDFGQLNKHSRLGGGKYSQFCH